MKYVLDTNAVSALMKGDPQFLTRLRSMSRADVWSHSRFLPKYLMASSVCRNRSGVKPSSNGLISSASS